MIRYIAFLVCLWMSESYTKELLTPEQAIDTAIVISQERYELANNRYTIGKASKLEVLNAQVDLNTDKTNYLNQKQEYGNTKIFLSELLTRELSTNFVVTEEAELDEKLLFEDLRYLTQEQIAKLQLENSEIAIKERQQNISSQLAMAYQTYVTNLELARLEKSSEDIAKENLDVTLDEFRIGTITTIEFRATQLNYIQDITRSSIAKFQAKLSDISLKELTGSLDF